MDYFLCVLDFFLSVIMFICPASSLSDAYVLVVAHLLCISGFFVSVVDFFLSVITGHLCSSPVSAE